MPPGRMPKRFYRPLVFWILMDRTRRGEWTRADVITELVGVIVSDRYDNPPPDSAIIRQHLIWLHNDDLITKRTAPDEHYRPLEWQVSDTSWAGRQDPRWEALYLRGTTPRRQAAKRVRHPQRGAGWIPRTTPKQPPGRLVIDEGRALKRNARPKTVFSPGGSALLDGPVDELQLGEVSDPSGVGRVEE